MDEVRKLAFGEAVKLFQKMGKDIYEFQILEEERYKQIMITE
jgi:hypothetical protein